MVIEIIVSLAVVVAIVIFIISLRLYNHIKTSKQTTISERFEINVPLLLKNKRDYLPNSFVPLSRDFLEKDYKDYLRLIDTKFFKDFNKM